MNGSGHPIPADTPGSPSSLPEAFPALRPHSPGTGPSCVDLPAHELLPFEALPAGPHVGQGPPEQKQAQQQLPQSNPADE